MIEMYQRIWDEANEKWQKIASLRREAEAARKAREAAKRAETERMLRSRFLAADGSPEEWERKRETYLDDHRRRQGLDAQTADDLARRRNAERYGAAANAAQDVAMKARNPRLWPRSWPAAGRWRRAGM